MNSFVKFQLETVIRLIFPKRRERWMQSWSAGNLCLGQSFWKQSGQVKGIRILDLQFSTEHFDLFLTSHLWPWTNFLLHFLQTSTLLSLRRCNFWQSWRSGVAPCVEQKIFEQRPHVTGKKSSCLQLLSWQCSPRSGNSIAF